MTINELDKELEKAIENFADMVKTNYEEYSEKPATHGDICELGRQTTYALFDMKAAIINYLKSN